MRAYLKDGIVTAVFRGLNGRYGIYKSVDGEEFKKFYNYTFETREEAEREMDRWVSTRSRIKGWKLCENWHGAA